MDNSEAKKMIYNSEESIEKDAPTESFLIAWLDDSLLIDKMEDVNLSDIFDKVQRMRIFNEQAELHLWRSKDKLKGRLKIDQEDNHEDYIDVDQLLWGTRIEESDSCIELFEDRGTYLKIPKFYDRKIDKNKRIFIKTRNYIGYTEANHATYVDCRFVKFVVK